MRTLIAIFLLVVVLVLGGCSNDDGNNTAADTAPSATSIWHTSACSRSWIGSPARSCS